MRLLLSVPVLCSIILFGVNLYTVPPQNHNLAVEKVETATAISDCSSWLYLPSKESYVRVGDLDIPGNQITVEALVMRTAPYTGSQLFAGDIVSKHEAFNDCNYLLRPNNAEITTYGTGYVKTPDICDIELNKVYHVAMVYDGTALKFYRNGFLMAQAPATGNLVQNNWLTQIGIYYNMVTNTQLVGYVDEVRIWNVARTQQQICQYMETSLPSPTTQTGLLAYYTFENLVNKQGNPTWNGTLGGAAVLNQANPQCANFVADSCSRTAGAEFIYASDLCDPLNIQFSSAGATVGDWTFGDGNTATGTATPSHLYAAPGDYTVTFTTRAGSCPKISVKQIAIRVTPDNVVLTDDTTICDGATMQLQGITALDYCWSPATFLDDPKTQNPVTSTTQNITYYLNALVPGNNLIVNGDFTAGNTGFVSQYTNANPNTTQGQYFIGTSPRDWNPNLFTCVDHTTGFGNMMLVNGAPVLDVPVWQQTVIVNPNTNYSFSTWVQDLGSLNPAQLQFSINGNTLGSLITATLPACNWKQFYTTWNSGNATSAVISIVNKNMILDGNDFALDDISFAQAIVKRDSVVITVDKPLVRTSDDTTVCIGAPAQLNTTGAQTYSWTPATGLSNTSIGNPIASPQSTTEYIVTGTTASGCTAKDTIVVSTHLAPAIAITDDTTICENASVPLLVSGGASYTWSPAATLNDPNIANPIASPTAETTYKVQITDANTCSHEDSVKVSIRPKPSFAVSPAQPVCEGDNITLVATGGDSYTWSPSASLSDANIPNPIANPDITTQYSVYALESQCNYDTTMQVMVTVNPLPNVVAEKSNDINCTVPTAQLMATGASTYLWSPAEGLDFPDIHNPKAAIDTSTVFWVTGTNQFGCTNVDTVHVQVLVDNMPLFLLPNAFSPNNDGYNDCFGVRNWGAVTLLEFSIFNRWGEKIFSTTNPGQCWDGNYKGRQSDTGGYAYVIRARGFCGEIKRTGVVMLVR